MSSVISPSHYPISPSSDGTCRRQSLSRDSCLPQFCKAFTKSSSECYKSDIPDLKVLAQNSVNAYGIGESGSECTSKQPRGSCFGVPTSRTLPVSCNSSVISVTLCGNKSVKDEAEKEKLHKAKPSHTYRIMQKDMKVERNRLETFKNIWPLNYIDPSDLAAVGFFYLQCGDKVQCAFCHGIIVDWAPGDDPLTEHALHFPLCPFLLNRDVGNIPISKKNSFVTSHSSSACPESSQVLRQSDHASNVKNSGATYPKFSDMKAKDKRLSTFRSWHYSAVKPNVLAEAGFFFTGTEDVVACFYCGGTLGHWVVSDDPWFEHKKHFPHCAFLKSRNPSTVESTHSVLQDTVSKTASSSSSSSDVTELMKSKLCVEAAKIFSENLVLEALKRQLSKKNRGFYSLEDLCSTILEIQDETQQKAERESGSQSHAKGTTSSSSDRHMCKICWDKEMGIVFLPCGHMVTCPDCAQSVVKCPLCRRTIENTIRAYMS